MENKNLNHDRNTYNNPHHSQSKHTHWQLQRDHTTEYDIISTFPLHRKRTGTTRDKRKQYERRI